MTLPASFPLSMSQVATELGVALPLSLNAPNVLTLAGLGAPPISMSNLLGKSNFTPVTNTYSAAGSFTETVPAAATQVVITMWGGGGGGSRDNASSLGSGGASGAYVRKTVAVTGGSTFSGYVGDGGLGHVTTDGNGSPGAASTITSPALSAGGGGGGLLSGAAATGGTASGGDINTNGNNSTADNKTGAAAPNAGSGQGRGGDAGWLGNGQNGTAGEITFSYT
jgi:hypothetical protein